MEALVKEDQTIGLKGLGFQSYCSHLRDKGKSAGHFNGGESNC